MQSQEYRVMNKSQEDTVHMYVKSKWLWYDNLLILPPIQKHSIYGFDFLEFLWDFIIYGPYSLISIPPNHSKVVQGHLAAAWTVAPHLNWLHVKQSQDDDIAS